MTEAVISPISWTSTHVKRVCKAALMAETFALIKAAEAGTRLRATIMDMKGKLDLRNWEESAANEMGHCWIDDVIENPQSLGQACAGDCTLAQTLTSASLTTNKLNTTHVDDHNCWRRQNECSRKKFGHIWRFLGGPWAEQTRNIR